MSRTNVTAAPALPINFAAFGYEVFAEYYPRSPFKWFGSLPDNGGKTIQVGRWVVMLGKVQPSWQ